MRLDTRRSAGALAVAAAAALLTAGCEITMDAGPYSLHEEKRFTVTGTPDLTLDTFDGSLEIRSWDKPEVLVEIEKRAADKTMAEAIKVKAEQRGSAILLEVKKPDGQERAFGLKVSPRAKLIATVPRHCNIVARSGDGSIRIERVTGRIELRTGDGGVHGISLAGDLFVHTGDGSLRFDDVDGTVDLESGDGGARLTGKLQGVRLRTGDGSVEVRATDGSAMASDWEVRTGDGGLRVELPDSFSATLDASTGDGAVRVRGFGEPAGGGRDRDGEGRGDLRRPINGGGKILRLRSESGTITIKTL